MHIFNDHKTHLFSAVCMLGFGCHEGLSMWSNHPQTSTELCSIDVENRVGGMISNPGVDGYTQCSSCSSMACDGQSSSDQAPILPYTREGEHKKLLEQLQSLNQQLDLCDIMSNELKTDVDTLKKYFTLCLNQKRNESLKNEPYEEEMVELDLDNDILFIDQASRLIAIFEQRLIHNLGRTDVMQKKRKREKLSHVHKIDPLNDTIEQIHPGQKSSLPCFSTYLPHPHNPYGGGFELQRSNNFSTVEDIPLCSNAQSSSMIDLSHYQNEYGVTSEIQRCKASIYTRMCILHDAIVRQEYTIVQMEGSRPIRNVCCHIV